MSKPDSLRPKSDEQLRPAELEDWLNANIYHPLSHRLASLLRPTFITPNAVSIAGGLMVVAAAAVYFNVPGAVGGALGLLLHISWHVLDGADGDLARMTGRTSELGEIIDGACDYLGHIGLYLTLAVILADEIGWIGAVLMVAAGLARALQATFFETQRRQYQFWVYDHPWLRVTVGSHSDAHSGLLTMPARLYLNISAALCAGGARIDALLAPMEADQRSGAAALAKTHMLPVIARCSFLSANYRTLIIGGSMIADEPIVIVLFELLALNVLLAMVWLQARRAIAALEDQLVSERGPSRMER